ncbi:N-acetylglucosamine-1-phosphodiester alpha-N-acetylglucosaminidase isoform X2 [Canis lupus familiaris]|uniref:N-acetylglucosamine-1-phosphodiester alpha-N-acetylglucosaminidase isoform X2 n=1 Tax=Canis lupus familiaris TaxID=9615 RepID=UPI000BAA3470|nr:N-acetylglucosamine-1-phosphodiester alpha-N-acetylglucosaminidase isoform X2 [Canis lupus familiaris]XP_025272382.3 N-acetylglucosamine-1-phosphodiester alpha-N-acetylglucosaminidase isoform X2 [Canis lupus dingo]XP_038396397.1 N-acetylglucosamine-1-phosphodiester alpha-N-acetylglucosaminidase isoform X2 [Canis lupus familiaris]XP_038525182.1 N-acetylglucosamine-1-phosphodiester alpha-N-acetylglucosaminidase isoform X2 [Canis lupus familiaris]|eukprot:XP_022275797.1 N-acetylglucosamine-1-phosphodiester alpha-N-acetylglucosaminidase isoform X2 [Canis lupus familiaris]
MAASMGRWLFLLALLGFLQEAASSLGSGASRDDDLLLPYSRARARPARDCSRVRAGSREHESWPPAPAAPGARAQGPAVRTFVSHFGSRAVPGHLTRAAEPLRTFSVLEPGGSGGCASRRRATVEETARAAGCRVAQNGGFFRMETGECLGNVVSDGRRVSSSGGLQNAQFGIRRDGTLVTGYLSEEEVLDTENPFVQLLSGVVWLIRNGSVYINDSQAAECDETQETGSFSKFVNVMSARTAVGHDRKGQLVLFHADGQTEQRGINLWEMAEFLLKQDVVNAINLDGGGSATFVLNGTLASYPSDHCQDNMWRCPRRVSTVVCVHEPRCQPPDCSGHGTCVEGRCQCTGHFWQGAACNKLDCGPSNCSQHGLCTETGCRCEAGWTGSNCSEACSNSSFGEDCAMKCRCQNGAACDPVWGTCTCTSGFTGDTCEQVKQCLRPSQTTLRPGELSLLTGSSWLALTLGLVFLLLISTVANVSLLLGSRAERSRHLDGAYVYHPLQEMNGELLAAEKEQPADAHNPFKD